MFQMKKEQKLRELRRKVREMREKDLRAEALRARSFSGEETFRQGLNLTTFAVKIHKAACEK